MAGAFRLERFGGIQQADHNSVKGRASTHSSQGDTCFHSDGNPLVDDHRLLVCEKSALPVLRVHRLVDTIPALEERYAPSLDVCDMHGAGVGMERVPKYQCKFAGGGWLLDHHSR